MRGLTSTSGANACKGWNTLQRGWQGEVFLRALYDSPYKGKAHRKQGNVQYAEHSQPRFVVQRTVSSMFAGNLLPVASGKKVMRS